MDRAADPAFRNPIPGLPAGAIKEVERSFLNFHFNKISICKAMEIPQSDIRGHLQDSLGRVAVFAVVGVGAKDKRRAAKDSAGNDAN